MLLWNRWNLLFLRSLQQLRKFAEIPVGVIWIFLLMYDVNHVNSNSTTVRHIFPSNTNCKEFILNRRNRPQKGNSKAKHPFCSGQMVGFFWRGPLFGRFWILTRFSGHRATFAIKSTMFSAHKFLATCNLFPGWIESRLIKFLYLSNFLQIFLKKFILERILENFHMTFSLCKRIRISKKKKKSEYAESRILCSTGLIFMKSKSQQSTKKPSIHPDSPNKNLTSDCHWSDP